MARKTASQADLDAANAEASSLMQTISLLRQDQHREAQEVEQRYAVACAALAGIASQLAGIASQFASRIAEKQTQGRAP